MAKKIHPSTPSPARGPGWTAAQWARRRVGGERGQAVAEIATGDISLRNPRQLGSRLVVSDLKRVRVEIGTGGCATDRRRVGRTRQVVVHHEACVERRAAFLTEWHIQLKFSHSEIHEIGPGGSLDPQVPLEPHHADKGAFQITIRRPRAKPRTPKLRRKHHTERDISVQGPETQDVETGEAKPTAGDPATICSNTGQLVAHRRPDRNRPEAHRDAFICGEVAIRTQLIALIAEDIPEVVELRESGDVAHIAGEIVFSREGGNGIRLLHESAPFITDECNQPNERDNDTSLTQFPLQGLHGGDPPLLLGVKVARARSY